MHILYTFREILKQQFHNDVCKVMSYSAWIKDETLSAAGIHYKRQHSGKDNEVLC